MQTINYKNYNIVVDQDPDPMSPSEFDTLGTILTQSGYAGTKTKPEDIREKLELKDIVWLPVYTYEHSGLRLQTTPFSCAWDSWEDGIIFVEKKKLEKEYAKYTQAEIEKILKAEVKTWDEYLSGEVYGYEITDSQGNNIDSCWGFYGDIDYCVSQAKNYIDSILPNSIKLLKKLK